MKSAIRHHSFLFYRDVHLFLSSSTEARVELSDQKEVNSSSFTQSSAGVQPTSLEQVQTLPTNKHVPVSYDNDQRGLFYSWRRKRERISLMWMLLSPTLRKLVSLLS